LASSASRSKKGKGYKTWSESHIERFEACHAIGTKAWLAFALLLYTGQRRGDVVKMGPQQIHRGVLTIDQGMTDGNDTAHLEIPVHPKLQAIIDAMPTFGLKVLPGDALRQALYGGGLRQLVS
jgi:integrase